MTYRRLRRSSFFLAALALAVSVPCAMCGSAAAQAQQVIDKLNEPWQRVQESNKTWKPILTAYLDMTKPPVDIGPEFDPGTIWPGMDKWSDWSAWAEKNAAMGKELVEQQSKLAFGMPYGDDKVDSNFKSRGLFVRITIDPSTNRVDCGYLAAIRAINAYAAADMWRLGAAGKFDDAFKVGLAHLRLLRQLCDQQLVEEKNFAMRTLGDALAIHRDFFQAYLEKIPDETFQRLGTKDYPYLRPADGERLRRIELPEGDRVVAEAVLRQCFDDSSQASPTMFAQVFAGMQSDKAPLERFGAVKRWSQLAALHGSLESSLTKLENVYDDWWRRWRTRQFDVMLTVPTDLSRLNPIRYAAVILAVRDLQDSFAFRRRLIAELDGTAIAAGLCGYKRGFGIWPDDLEKLYTGYFPKKFDFDPYDKEYGRFIFKNLGGTKRPIDTVWGRLFISSPVLYSRGGDFSDDGFRSHDATGASGDLILWPALRELARSGGASE
ncbi:MAG: hypothetical protein SGJ09_18120 [Phycisphaerae bacterium]|nr:hypothetical protein [Phycisphaerae bacterium]